MDFSMFESLQHTADTQTYSNAVQMNKNVKHKSMSEMNRFPEKTPLAMAYVPMQQWKETYDIEDGFCRGTVFPELDLPFAPEEGCL